MSIVRPCRKFFDAAVRGRGERYFAQGRVKLGAVSNRAAHAEVRGSSAQRYRVTLAWPDEDPLFLRAACDCPHYGQGEFCKHLWATLLAIDDAGAAEGIDGSTHVVLRHEFDGGDLDGDDFEDLDGAEEEDADAPPPGRDLWHLVRRGVSGPPVRQSARSSAWRTLLRSVVPPVGGPLDGGRGVAVTEREAWFVVNPQSSRRTGGLVVEFHHRQRRKDGTLGKLKREGVGPEDVARYTDPHDRRLLELVLGNEVPDGFDLSGYGYRDRVFDRSNARRIAPVMHDLLLPRLCATGRLAWPEGSDLSVESFRPLAWDAGEPWRFRVKVEDVPGKAQWRITGTLWRADEPAVPGSVLLALADGLVILPGRLARLADARCAGWIGAFGESGAFTVPHRERDAFLAHWWAMPDRPEADFPPALALACARGEPAGYVAFRTDARRSGMSRRDASVDAGFDYAGQRVEWDASAPVIVDLEAGTVIERNREAESTLVGRLDAAGVRHVVGYYGAAAELRIAAGRVPAAVRSLLEEGWLVTVDGARLRTSGEFTLNVTSGIDWFDLETEADFDGQTVRLPALLRAARAGQREVRLDDGSLGMLSEDWLARFRALADLGEAGEEGVRFTRAQAPLLDALLAADGDAEIRVDRQFSAWRERLRDFAGIAPAQQPPTLRGTLRGYQCEGLAWLQFLDEFGIGGCLADDMGLGKTVQVLALLEGRRERRGETAPPSIVVAPKSLVWNWIEEAARFAPGLRVLDYTGTGRVDALERLDEHDLVITTYGTLRRDILRLREQRFDYAILDEAQAIKNAKSQAAKASRLLQADRRLAVTGTPVENHLGELWSIFEFLNPGLLGRTVGVAAGSRSGTGTSPELAQTLAASLRPFILRRTKAQVLTDLPPKTEQTLHCELPPKQRKLYDELRDYYRALLDTKLATVGLARSKIHVLEALLRLRQAACHPGLVDRTRIAEGSAKVETLIESLRDVVSEGHRALVFSQFTSFLAIVRTEIERIGIPYEYLDGRTRDRAARVTRFQDDPDCPLFLISLKAGGQGLNLTAADYVFILDPWWNPAVEAQAVDRAHRIGQARSVFAYRLIARDTVEEKILALQAKKRALADAIVTADKSLVKSLTAEDLALLLG